LLQLITLLQSGSAGSAKDLMSELGVSRRTLFRDLKVLQLAGIPYYHDSTSGYQVARSFFLPPISLTIPETLGLMLLGKFAAGRRDMPLRDAALGAIHKLTATIPEPIRGACGDLMANVTVNPGAQATQATGNRFYTDLQRCIDEGRVCSVTYKSPVEPEPFNCRLKPYALHFVTRAWYVLGYTDSHKEVRVFKLSRFSSIQPTESRFTRPARFNAQDKLGKAWQLIPEGRVYRVELEFTPKVATNVSEVLWHPSQQHHLLPDGRCRMTFEVDGLGEIAWWLCGYAGQVRVLKPAALRTRVREMFQRGIEVNNGELSKSANK